MDERKERRVVCAATRRKDLDILVCSPRHFDSTYHQTVARFSLDIRDALKTGEQGFVDQWGVFMDRSEAYVVAKAANQIIRRVGGDEQRLYSENLY